MKSVKKDLRELELECMQELINCDLTSRSCDLRTQMLEAQLKSIKLAREVCKSRKGENDGR